MGDEPPETRGPARLPLADVQRGIILTIPMAVVFGPIGVTFGVIAVDAGLSPLNAVLMSLLVYAGAAQLAAIQLLALGAPMLSVVATAAAVNSRYLVLSASIAPHFSGFRRLARSAYGVGLTDATYAIHIGRFASGPPRRAEIFTTNILAHSVWVGGTAIGVTVGQAIPDLARYGIDFAISAMFIALVVPLIQSRRDLAVALTAAAASGIFIMAGFAHWTVLAATAVAMIMAWGMSRWTKA